MSDQVSKVIGACLENGANMVRNIRFYIKDKASLEKQGLRQATKEAMGQAQVLADAAGVTRGRIVSISTQPIASPYRVESIRAAGIASTDASVELP